MDVTFQAKYQAGDKVYVVQQEAADFRVKEVEVLDVVYEAPGTGEPPTVSYRFKLSEEGKLLKAKENMLNETRALAEGQLVEFAKACLEVYDNRILEVTEEYNTSAAQIKTAYDETLAGLEADKKMLQSVVDGTRPIISEVTAVETPAEDTTPIPNES